MLTNRWRNIFFTIQWWQPKSGFNTEQIAILKHSKIICQDIKKKRELLKIVMSRKINKLHLTKRNVQFFLFVYWLFIFSWETLKPDFQAILCNYGNPESSVFKRKPSFSRRNTTAGTGTSKRQSKHCGSWDGFVDFWLSHRPKEQWSLTNKDDGVWLPPRSACKWPRVGSPRCEMLGVTSSDRELWGASRNNGKKA